MSTPKLRFREFKDEWTVLALETVTEKIQDGTHFSPVQQEQGNYKYITSKNIRNGFMDLRDISFLSDEAHKEIYKRCDVKFNDVLLTKDGASTGAVCLNELNEEFSLLSSVAFLRANNNIASNDFIYQVLAGPKGQYEIKASIAGQAITRITLNKIRNYRFHFPSLPEQQKIASFLSAVDEKIQQLTRKKELLEQYKKGAMQQLFAPPSSSELGLEGLKDDRINAANKNPSIQKSYKSQFRQLRFKDANGKPYPKWEEKRLGEVVSITKGKGISKTDIVEDGELECIRYGELYTHYKERITSIVSRTNLSSSDLVLSEYNDVIIPSSGETQLDIARAACVLKAGVALGGDLNILKTKENGVFLSYYINHSLKFDIAKVAQGNSVVHLYPSQLEILNILIPSKEEQQKIASFLTALDAKIENVIQQVVQTQNFKKGLLQQMFV